MALRVLLADESPTIKKVFQLALQDFAVEVRPVNIGVDVASVAGNFKPDLIFADVLLQKKNGYEVCAELKQDKLLRGIPVVLMWSGFMELDEDKFQACQANAQLEKPFDVAALRKLVTDLVPRTQNQKLSEFLTFPNAQVKAEPPAAKGPLQRKPSDEEFTDVPMPKMKGTSSEKYRLQLHPDELESVPVDYHVPGEKSVLATVPEPADEVDDFTVRTPQKAAPTPAAKSAPPPLPPTKPQRLESDFDVELDEVMPKSPSPAPVSAPEVLSAAQLEKIIRAQSAEMIESVVWRVIPELATQIIERELNKLLKERDSHPFP